MLINAECTIYHKSFDAVTATYDTITRLNPIECFWDDVKNRNKSNAGFENADKCFIMIHDLTNYVKPKEWESLVVKGDAWTVTEGDKIVRGNIAVSVPFEDLDKLYDDVFNVTSEDLKDMGTLCMHHIEIGAK